MPINASPEFLSAQRKYLAAGTLPDKIRTLQEMISVAPKHKGAEKLHRELSARMVKFRDELEREKKNKGARKSVTVKKDGFQIVIIGFPNSGKSTLLKKLTNADPKIADYPFTTKEPEIGMLDFGRAQIQVVEIPALVENAAEEQAELMSIIMNADGIILIYENEKQKQTLMNELYKFGIERQIMFVEKGEVPKKEAIFNFYDLIRVYTKEPGEERSAEKPIVTKRGTTVIETAQRVHKDFAMKFKFARVWGSARFPGQRVEKDYVLKDNDTVEFHAE